MPISSDKSLVNIILIPFIYSLFSFQNCHVFVGTKVWLNVLLINYGCVLIILLLLDLILILNWVNNLYDTVLCRMRVWIVEDTLIKWFVFVMSHTITNLILLNRFKPNILIQGCFDLFSVMQHVFFDVTNKITTLSVWLLSRKRAFISAVIG